MEPGRISTSSLRPSRTRTAAEPTPAATAAAPRGWTADRATAAVAPDGTIYLIVATWTDLALYAFTPQGAVAWTAPLTGTSGANGGANGSPLAVGEDGRVYAFCAQDVCTFGSDGRPSITFGTPGSQPSQIVLAPQVGLVYVSDVAFVSAYTLEGALAWSYSPPDASTYQPVAFADGRGTAYLSAPGNVWPYYGSGLTTVSASGGVGWTLDPVSAAAMGAEGTVYAIGAAALVALAP